MFASPTQKFLHVLNNLRYLSAAKRRAQLGPAIIACEICRNFRIGAVFGARARARPAEEPSSRRHLLPEGTVSQKAPFFHKAPSGPALHWRWC